MQNLVNMEDVEEPPKLLILTWVYWTAIVENENGYIFYDNIWINLSNICFYIISGKT